MFKKSLFVIAAGLIFVNMFALGLLEDITIKPADNNTEIILELDKVINFTDFSITSPHIIVFDLIAVDNGVVGTYYEPPAVTGIKSIEIMKDNESNFLRVMMEIDRKYEYTKEYRGNNVVITLDNDLEQTFETWNASEESSVQKEDDDLNTYKTDFTVSMDVENADVVTLLRGIADYVGINLIISNEVSGNVTVHVKDVPWKDLFDMVTRLASLTYEEYPNMIRVGTYKEFATEQTAMEQSLPMVTQVYKLEFADPKQLNSALKPLLSRRGQVSVDSRTNALIVKDINDVHKKIQDVVQELDRKNLQVEIVVKVVEISQSVSKGLGIQWSLQNIGYSEYNVAGGASMDAPIAGPGSVNIGTVRDFAQIQATLSALEETGRSKTLSNPRITATNNTEAEILSGTQFFVQSVDQNGNIVNTQYTAGTILNVTPHVNSMNDITLDIYAELSSVDAAQANPTIRTTTAKTVQMVQDGETVVMGGFVRKEESRSEEGLPFLKSIPVLGHLFKSDQSSNTNQEVLIFISPHIVKSVN
ncbi:MAG: secretin N-terminal domain-containing protein [candidate division WOR-3 bacterium]|nr:secretin N-terminal domain-containing protein [candidate division WOR-3 bacterium]